MDTLSHGLWALAIFWGTSYRWWAFLLGMIPDLLSFGIYIPIRLIEHGFPHGPPTASTASSPQWLVTSYSITHSFITWIVIGVVLYFVWRKYWPIVFAPMAHIALDIPTHNTYFPTPFLEPLSHYRYFGTSWGTPWIFFLNWGCLAIIFILIGYYEWNRRRLTPRAPVAAASPVLPHRRTR